MEALYEQEVARLFDVVRRLLQTAEQSSSNGGKQTLPLRDISAKLQSIERVIKQLETEARTKSNAASRRTLEEKVKDLKKDWKDANSRYKKLETVMNQEELLGISNRTNGNELYSAEDDRFRQMDRRLEDGTSRLRDSTKRLSEIEQVALGITENLESQSAQIRSAHQKVKETAGATDQARRLIQMMERRSQTQKIVMKAVTGFVGLLLLWLAWRMLT